MVKKISVLIASILLLLCLFFLNRVPVINNANQNEVYLSSYSMSSQIKKVHKKDFKFILGVKGECYTIDVNDFCLDEFLRQLNATIIFTENLSNVDCYYGYSPNIKYLEMVKGRLINVHIAISKSYVKIGCPIIYGSF